MVRRLVTTFVVLTAASPALAQQTSKGTVTITSVDVDGQAATLTINGAFGNFAQGWDGNTVNGYIIDTTTKVILDDIAQVAVQDPPVAGQRTFTIKYRNVPTGTYLVFVKGLLSNQGPPLQTQDVVSATQQKAIVSMANAIAAHGSVTMTTVARVPGDPLRINVQGTSTRDNGWSYGALPISILGWPQNGGPLETASTDPPDKGQWGSDRTKVGPLAANANVITFLNLTDGTSSQSVASDLQVK